MNDPAQANLFETNTAEKASAAARNQLTPDAKEQRLKNDLLNIRQAQEAAARPERVPSEQAIQQGKAQDPEAVANDTTNKAVDRETLKADARAKLAAARQRQEQADRQRGRLPDRPPNPNPEGLPASNQ
ncbi:hypothetical protein HYX70_02195 [Candidatus Saccharibacteria bacterium]|nr:hypothetical protein [Candidatus Saccharibacteria bacterium]